MKNNKGVSLAELSIVLVVIGLLLAAVAGGVSIRKNAEIRGFMSDINGFQIAIEGFYSKYNDLPGDMPDAFTHWDNGANTVCGTAAQCNGNGDGQITVNGADGNDSEAYRAWQHLVLSEFLVGSYTGTATVSNIQADIGINVPASKRSAVGYSIGYANTGGGSRNEITIGAFLAGNVNTSSALTPAEALAIDQKIDDGVPGTGIVHGLDGSDATAGNCVTAGAYNTSTTLVSCRQTFSARP